MKRDGRMAAAVAPDTQRDLLYERAGRHEDSGFLTEFARYARFERLEPSALTVCVALEIGWRRSPEFLERRARRLRPVVSERMLGSCPQPREFVVGHALYASAPADPVRHRAIALLDEMYAREIARLIDAPLISVQRIVDALERDEIVVTLTRHFMSCCGPTVRSKQSSHGLRRCIERLCRYRSDTRLDFAGGS